MYCSAQGPPADDDDDDADETAAEPAVQGESARLLLRHLLPNNTVVAET